MRIRTATQDDCKQIADIQIESWRDTYAENLPTSYLAGPIVRDLRAHWKEWDVSAEDLVLVAEGGTILGFVAVWCRPDPFIDSLHVKPFHRSAGLGGKLMHSVFRQLVERGYETAYLWVVESNEAAIRFYERLGGIITDRAAKNLLGHDVPNLKIEGCQLDSVSRP